MITLKKGHRYFVRVKTSIGMIANNTLLWDGESFPQLYASGRVVDLILAEIVDEKPTPELPIT